MASIDAYIAMGSNLGDRARNLGLAVEAVEAFAKSKLVALSRIYESDAVGPGSQGRYLNAALCLHTALPARRLLELLLEVERQHGRNRAAEVRWGPRSLDLDLLFYGCLEIDEPGLVVPHPRLHERAFVLAPLCDLAPALLHPERKQSMSELASQVDVTQVAVWGEPEDIRRAASTTPNPN